MLGRLRIVEKEILEIPGIVGPQSDQYQFKTFRAFIQEFYTGYKDFNNEMRFKQAQLANDNQNKINESLHKFDHQLRSFITYRFEEEAAANKEKFESKITGLITQCEGIISKQRNFQERILGQGSYLREVEAKLKTLDYMSEWKKQAEKMIDDIKREMEAFMKEMGYINEQQEEQKELMS